LWKKRVEFGYKVNKQIMPANQIKYRGTIYDYSASKDNVLTYITQPEHYYDDWTENGGILVVKYQPEHDEAHQYYVLHELNVSEGSGHIYQENLHEYGKNGGNRYAEVVESNK
jgi:hypothetical protein